MQCIEDLIIMQAQSIKNLREKVVLAKTIAEIHEVELKEINRIINNNIDEFEEGIDILDLKGNEDFEVIANHHGLMNQNAINRSSNIYLLSEQGYIALIEFMKTEKAKELRKKFRREYFAILAKDNGDYQVPLEELGFSNRDISISKNIYMLLIK